MPLFLDSLKSLCWYLRQEKAREEFSAEFCVFHNMECLLKYVQTGLDRQLGLQLE